jgi:hypothetical protein
MRTFPIVSQPATNLRPLAGLRLILAPPGGFFAVSSNGVIEAPGPASFG